MSNIPPNTDSLPSAIPPRIAYEAHTVYENLGPETIINEAAGIDSPAPAYHDPSPLFLLGQWQQQRSEANQQSAGTNPQHSIVDEQGRCLLCEDQAILASERDRELQQEIAEHLTTREDKDREINLLKEDNAKLKQQLGSVKGRLKAKKDDFFKEFETKKQDEIKELQEAREVERLKKTSQGRALKRKLAALLGDIEDWKSWSDGVGDDKAVGVAAMDMVDQVEVAVEHCCEELDKALEHE